MVKKLCILLLLLSLVAIPFDGARAIPSGVGVIGDSASQAYQCIGRGNETSFTWTEILARVRGINFGRGVCQAYNHAVSGETIAFHMAAQTTKVLADYKAGKIGKVVIMLGHNDFYSSPSSPDVPSLLATYRTNVNRLIKAGIAPRNILIIDVSQENQQGSKKALIDQFNAGLKDLVKEKGMAFSSVVSFQAELACRSTDGGLTYNVGGHVIYNRFGNEWHNFRIADGHLGTLANGILANTLMTDFLGVPRMSDAKLLSIVNGKVIPSNPPPTCSSTLGSISAQDGWILESSENSNRGGPLSKTASTFFLGDDAQKKQYRSILSFTTKDLPDKAVITKVTLMVKKQAVLGGNPVKAFQGFLVDIKKGFFGSAAGLQASDFQGKANQSYGPFKPALSAGWYSIDLTPAKAYINKLNTNGGVTQVRLRFKLDDNNNAKANYLSLYSGDAPADSCPQLIVEYHIP